MNKIEKKQLLFSSIVFLLMIIMTFWYILQIDKIKYSSPSVVVTFFIIGAITIFNVIRDDKPFSLNKVFWYFNFFFLFLAPLLQYFGGYQPWNYYISESIYFKCNLLIILWMVIYTIINIYIDSKKKLKDNYKEKVLETSKKEIPKLIVYSMIAIAILIALIGFGNMFVREGNAVDIGSDLINSITSKFLRSIPIFCLAIYMLLVKKQKTKRSIFIMLILATLVLISNFPTSISRYWIGASYLGLVLILFKDKMKNRAFDIILIFTLAVVFPFFTLFKNNDLMTVLSNRMVLSIDKMFYNVDFDAYSMFARIIIYTKDFGFEYGHQLLCTLFFFIPRAIWVTKPYPTGMVVATKQDAFFTNLSSPLISEAYIDFGIIGVIIYAIIISYIISKLDNIYWKRKDSNNIGLIDITYPFMLGFMLFLQRGSMQPVVTHAFSFYLFIAMKYTIPKFIKRGKPNEMLNN